MLPPPQDFARQSPTQLSKPWKTAIFLHGHDPGGVQSSAGSPANIISKKRYPGGSCSSPSLLDALKAPRECGAMSDEMKVFHRRGCVPGIIHFFVHLGANSRLKAFPVCELRLVSKRLEDLAVSVFTIYKNIININNIKFMSRAVREA